MTRTAFLTAAALAWPIAVPAQGLTVHRVADGVIAFVQPDASRFDDSNATAIVLDTGVLVVDTQTAPSVAREVIAEIRRLTDRPVRWVLNTHWHGDHVHGNQAYRETFPGVRFLAQAATREDMATRAAAALKEDQEGIAAWLGRAEEAVRTGRSEGARLSDAEADQLRARIERRRAYLARLREVTALVLPDETFAEALTLHDGREVRLLHFPGHTRGDVVVFLPAERVLVTGDLLDDLPFTGHGSPRALVATLAALEALDWDTMIPGHGSVRTGKDHLRRVAGLFRAIVAQVDTAARQGLSLDETKKKVDLGSHRAYFVTDDASARYWDFFIGEAIARAYEDAGRMP